MRKALVLGVALSCLLGIIGCKSASGDTVKLSLIKNDTESAKSSISKALKEKYGESFGIDDIDYVEGVTNLFGDESNYQGHAFVSGNTEDEFRFLIDIGTNKPLKDNYSSIKFADDLTLTLNGLEASYPELSITDTEYFVCENTHNIYTSYKFCKDKKIVGTVDITNCTMSEANSLYTNLADDLSNDGFNYELTFKYNGKSCDINNYSNQEEAYTAINKLMKE
jgi:hypothetical protein